MYCERSIWHRRVLLPQAIYREYPLCPFLWSVNQQMRSLRRVGCLTSEIWSSVKMTTKLRHSGRTQRSVVLFLASASQLRLQEALLCSAPASNLYGMGDCAHHQYVVISVGYFVAGRDCITISSTANLAELAYGSFQVRNSLGWDILDALKLMRCLIQQVCGSLYFTGSDLAQSQLSN